MIFTYIRDKYMTTISINKWIINNLNILELSRKVRKFLRDRSTVIW